VPFAEGVTGVGTLSCTGRLGDGQEFATTVFGASTATTTTATSARLQVGALGVCADTFLNTSAPGSYRPSVQFVASNGKTLAEALEPYGATAVDESIANAARTFAAVVNSASGVTLVGSGGQLFR